MLKTNNRYEPDKSLIKVFLKHPGYRFTTLKDICNRTSIYNPIGIIARIWYRRLYIRYGFQIPHTTKIGKGFYLGHFGNIVINSRCIIGSNCNVNQGVTIGEVKGEIVDGVPIIGDEVWIGANSVIVGNIKIANNVLIAPLSFVNFDIPSGAVVIGNPARIVNYKGSSRYINNKV